MRMHNWFKTATGEEANLTTSDEEYTSRRAFTCSSRVSLAVSKVRASRIEWYHSFLAFVTSEFAAKNSSNSSSQVSEPNLAAS